MVKVTTKNTKDQILEAYNEALETIKTLKEGKVTTAEVVKAKEIVEVKEKAKKIIDLEILNDDIKDKYAALLKTVELLETEIEELYGIKKESDTLEALINSNKDKNRELDADYKARVAEIDADLANRKASIEKQAIELRNNYKKLEAELKVEFEEGKAKLEKDRAREIEEYNYDLNRKRIIENHEWEGEKTAREEALALKETAVKERETAMDEINNKVTELEREIEELKISNKEAVDTSYKEGKEKAAKDYHIQKASIEREAKWTKEKLEEKIAALEEAINKEVAAHQKTSEKLDEAYKQIQEIATKTVQSSGQIRVIESSKN